MKNKKFLFCLLAAITALVLASCASVGTVQSRLEDDQFKMQNLPVRTLRVCVVTDPGRKKDSVAGLLREVSLSLAEQVGIRLETVMTADMTFETSGQDGMINQLYKKVFARRSDFDIAIAFTSFSTGDYLLKLLSLVTVPLPVWHGAIDDTYRRYIVVKSLDKQVLIHEIFHAFIFARAHGGGVMRAVSLQPLPFMRPVGTTVFLTESDRKEVLLNKWRNFSEPATIAKAEPTGAESSIIWH
ncbi:MAG: hypothetical protein M0Z67_04780 [Nitrospiraceae bacterium]|nr:hypothetical protein [Nitrospiraceae bacterium]